MKSLILILLIFNYCNCFSLDKNKYEKYIQAVIEEAYKGKKVYIFSHFYNIKRRQVNKFYTILFDNYGIDSLEWESYWSGYRNNIIDYNIWYRKGISTYRKNRILGKFDEQKGEVLKKKRFSNAVALSYSSPLFISSYKSDYILEITSHCYGLCSYSWIYFVHFNKQEGKIEIKHKILSSVS